MNRYSFSRKINADFSQTLSSRVQQYFKDNEIDRGANMQMVLKTIAALSMYFVPYFIMIISGSSNIIFLVSMWMIMGLALTFIGTSIMHDALHGSYSRHNIVNKLLGFTAVIIGVDPTIWKIQHNGLHHSFTNIEHADEDIDMNGLFRLTPYQERKWYHQFQHIYAPFIYSLSTIFWTTVKDFKKAVGYKEKGLIKPGKQFHQLIIKMVARKSLYHIIFLVLPILLIPIPAWMTILMFIGMHLMVGLLISLIFQTAHIMPEVSFIKQTDRKIEENWTVHQLQTTTNYAPKNKVLSWFIGGLNYQVEHHLFPQVCHVHYSGISKIVKQTTSEYKLPYYSEKSFRSAIISHFGMLKSLGQPN